MEATVILRLALAAIYLCPLLGCRTTPEEIARIQMENELLREQIQIVRSNCSYYRDVKVEIEDEEGELEEPAPVK